MPTPQELGGFGKLKVTKDCVCPKCKRASTLKKLSVNFKCADIICDFCGFLGQVKAARVASIEIIPKTIPGAAWKPQQERMEAAIYFPLFLVLCSQKSRKYAIYYLAADLQKPEIFQASSPLSGTARRGQGFVYETDLVKGSFVRLV
jgi:Dam-replacing family